MYALAGIFIAAFVTGLSGAMAPGPLLAVTVTSAAKRGSLAGLYIVIGHAIIESSLVVLIFFGAASLLLGSPLALRVLGGAGAAVLLVMGILMLRDVPKLSFSKAVSKALDSQTRASRLQHPVISGLLLTLLNPTFPVWWAGMGLALMTKYGTSGQNAAVFYAGHISSDLAWYLAVASAVSLGRRFISDRAYKVFIALCAIFLIIIAGLFAWSAITGNNPAAM